MVCCTVGVKQSEWSICTLEHHCFGLLRPCYGLASCTDIFEGHRHTHAFICSKSARRSELLFQEVNNSVASVNRAAKAVKWKQVRGDNTLHSMAFQIYLFHIHMMSFAGCKLTTGPFLPCWNSSLVALLSPKGFSDSYWFHSSTQMCFPVRCLKHIISHWSVSIHSIIPGHSENGKWIVFFCFHFSFG